MDHSTEGKQTKKLTTNFTLQSFVFSYIDGISSSHLLWIQIGYHLWSIKSLVEKGKYNFSIDRHQLQVVLTCICIIYTLLTESNLSTLNPHPSASSVSHLHSSLLFWTTLIHYLRVKKLIKVFCIFTTGRYRQLCLSSVQVSQRH